ncbi:Neuroguidin [Smittium culicis]|uniref:Neuroguidin n=1 Tax=Smittium culicis TaxID=133412 RepID=A0A1R1XRB4_9FUNG|nr:Neuroguidin [Smittium culicis]
MALEIDNFTSHLSQISNLANELAFVVDKLSENVSSKDYETEQGISLLTIKYYTLLEYVSNLSFVATLKLNKVDIESHPVIDRLIENRLYLEKIKPIEQRMRYQIDKLIRTALTTNSNDPQISSSKLGSTNPEDISSQQVDPLNQDESESLYKPKLDSLMASAKAQGILESRSSSSLQQSDPNKAYQPPKLIPVHYDEDDSLKAKREKAELRLKERAKKSQIINELISEFDARPEKSSSWGTSSTVGVAQNEKFEADRLHREKYEEDNFIRMTISKKDKKRLKQGTLRLDDEFAGLEDFAGIDTLSRAASSSNAKRKNVVEKRAPSSSSTASINPFSNPSAKKLKSGKFQSRKR